MPFEKSVGAVVFRREKKKILYLALRHPNSKRKTQYWNFPKGHVEKGETWEDTLRREIWEEAGIKNLKIIPGFYVWNKYFYRAVGKEREKRKKSKIGINIFKIVTYYLAETKSKRIKLSHEHIDHKWLEYKKALGLLTYKQTKNVLEKANKFLMDKNA
jgi:bis(5'-nucleosidyl)-tetraphosphatase